MAGARTSLGRNVIWLMAAHVAYVASAFTVVLVVSRAFGPEPLGTWRFAQALLSIGVVTADAGITAVAIRDVAAARGVLARYEGPAIAIRLVLATVLTVVLAVGLLVGGSPDAAFILVAFLGVFPAALSLAHLLHGLQRLTDVAKTRLVAQVGGSLIGLLALLLTGQLVALVLPTLILGLGVDWWIVRMLRGAPRAEEPPIDGSRTVAVLRAGAPFLSASLAIQLVTSADAILIGVILGAQELGIYAAAYVIAGQLLLLAGPVAAAIYPRLSSASDASDGPRVLLGALNLIGAVAWPVCLSAAILAPVIIGILYPPDYAAAAPLLATLLGMTVIGYYNAIATVALNSIGRQAAVMSVAWLAAGVNVTANILLIPRFGVAGAAATALATEVVTAVAYTVLLRPRFALHPIRNYLSGLPHAAISGVLLALLMAAGVPVFVAGLVSASAWFALAWVRPSRGHERLRAIMLDRLRIAWTRGS